MFTRALAGEVGPWNITANCYSPGMIPTQMNHFAELPSERQNRLLDTLTLRHWGEAKDVARQRVNGHALELWCGDRKVATVKPNEPT